MRALFSRPRDPFFTPTANAVWIAIWISICIGLQLCLFATASAQRPVPADASRIVFEDATAKSGVAFAHVDGSSGKNYLVEFMGAGVASLDFDRDGRLDLYFLNGRPLSANMFAENRKRLPTNELFRNSGGLRFERASSPSRSDETGYGLGVTVGDYDGDGFEDLFVNNFGANELLHNNGDGTFSPVGQMAGLKERQDFGAGTTFLDADNDGDLDLFVGNYVDFQFDIHAKLAPQAFPFPPGPKDFAYAADNYFINNGDGSFTDATSSSQIGNWPGPTMGVIAGDFDADGLLDILAVSDGAANHLYRNQGNNRFHEDAVPFGIAYDAKGHSNGSMGVDASDYNGDQLADFLVTTYVNQYPTLFENLGEGFFEDATRRSKIGSAVLPHVNWTGALGDLDLDGDIDAFICNGHFLRGSEALTEQTDFGVSNSVMSNHRGSFSDVSHESSTALRQTASSRGAALDDLDGDGDLDIAILNCGDQAQLLENTTLHLQSESHRTSGPDSLWLQIDLVGTESNRDAIGAKVSIRLHAPLNHHASSPQPTQTRFRLGGRGYQSHFGSRLHFAMERQNQSDSALRTKEGETNVPADAESHRQDVLDVTVDWPNGRREQFERVASNRIVTLVEGTGRELKSP